MLHVTVNTNFMAAKKKYPAGVSFSPKYMPKDALRILLKKQGELKTKCLCPINREKVIYKIIRFVEDKNLDE